MYRWEILIDVAKDFFSALAAAMPFILLVSCFL